MLHHSSFAVYTATEVRDQFREIRDMQPTLGYVFSSTSIGIPELVAELAMLDTPAFGCTTGGEILSCPGCAPVSDQSAVCCFIDPDPSLFSVMLFEKGSLPDDELGRQIGRWGATLFEKPGFLIVISGLATNAEAIVRGMEESCPPNTPVFGAVAADDGDFVKTTVYTHQGSSTNGAAVIAFDRAKVTMDGIASSGWTGVGVDMVITSSEGNTVYTINDKPATQVISEYLNVDEDDLVRVGVTFPLLMKMPDGNEVLRAFLSADHERGALVFAGFVPQGSRVRFSSSFGYTTIRETIQRLEDYHTTSPQADLILLFSCMARYRVAGPLIYDEIRTVFDLWNAPVIGFFAYGEMGCSLSSPCVFYNETLTLVRLVFPGE